MKLPHLSDWLPSKNAELDSPLMSLLSNTVSTDETCLDVIIIDGNSETVKQKYRQWIRAGPRQILFFDPRQVVAGIVTCGGLCPGLNNVIQVSFAS
jgi:6-phosphofructokinase 1